MKVPNTSPLPPDLILTGDVFWIDVDKISPNPFQPRLYFAEAEMEDLAASIKEHGVLQPILVRPLRDKRGRVTRYELVFGERRWRASQLAGLPQIKATVREVSDIESAEIALIENLNAQALTDFEEAQGIKTLWETYEKNGQPMSLLKMAARLKTEDGHKRSATFVQNRMALLNLDDELLEVAKRRRMVMSSLFEIAKVKDEEIRSEAIEMVEAGKGFRLVAAFIENQLAAKKRLKESTRAPDTETAQRARANEATGGGSVSRGRQVTGHSVSERREEAQNSLERAIRNLEFAEEWMSNLSEKDKQRYSQKYGVALKEKLFELFPDLY